MDNFEEQLAEAVRKYDHLYNTSIKSYKDIQMANNSWKEIAQTLSTDESVCRRKWRYLRDKFAKAKRRVQQKKSGDSGGKTAVPALYVSLQWLDRHIKHRETTTNFTVSLEDMDPDPEEGPSCNLSLNNDSICMRDLEFSALESSELYAPPTHELCTAGSSTPVPNPPSGSSTPVPNPPSGSSTPVPTPSTDSTSPTSPRRSRFKKRKRESEPISNFEAALAVLDRRRAEREAAVEEGRQRRESMLQLMDPCGRYVLHVADFMRSLPPELVSEFKWKLQNLMYETEQKRSQVGVYYTDL